MSGVPKLKMRPRPALPAAANPAVLARRSGRAVEATYTQPTSSVSGCPQKSPATTYPGAQQSMSMQPSRPSPK